MTKKLIIMYIFIFLFTSSRPHADEQSKKEVWITIFVHGIMNIQPHLTIPNIIRFWNDDIEDSNYIQAVKLLRDDPYFQQYHAMQEIGLQKIDLSLQGPGFASSALANTIEMLNHYKANDQEHYYYTFGWSGLLSAMVRYQEAELLYDAIINELHLLHEQGKIVHIRLIGYSQGGNLVIQLGVVHNRKQNPLISIDQLVLLGAPLIQEDYDGIGSSLFKTIYNFYSMGDRVQPIDCLSGGIFLSGRIFKSTGNFVIPPHLKQVEYRIKRIAYHKPTHKAPKRFHKRMLRNADPGHTELWSFGWVHNYRSYFPLYPLPAVAFVPYIIQSIEQITPQAQYITADIRPYEETMILTDQKIPNVYYKTDFFTYNQLNAIRTLVEQYRPDHFNKKIFDKKTEQAIAQSAKMSPIAQAA